MSDTQKSESSLVKSTTGTSQKVRVSETSRRSSGTKDKQIFLLEGFPVSHIPLPANEEEAGMNVICGENVSEPYAEYDPNTHSLRTYQGCLFPSLEGSSTGFCQTFTTAGMMQSGRLFRLPMLERPISDNESGFLPTPRAAQCDYWTQEYAIRKAWLCDSYVNGLMNPQWVELLMGYPTDWTDSKPSETR